MVLVEAVCCTLDDALAASDAGADRLELCSAIEVGGLTPSLGLLAQVRRRVSLPLMTMVRPRPGDFEYGPSDWAVLEADARWLLDAGADGLVVGALVGGEPDSRLAEIAMLKPGTCTFHRAIDACTDRVAAARIAREWGFARALTSGGSAKALEGAATIRAMAAEIPVLVCGGVRAANVLEILRATGATEIHAGPRSITDRPFLSDIASFGANSRLDAVALAALVEAAKEFGAGFGEYSGHAEG
jgi:copper homeostasis protein